MCYVFLVPDSDMSKMYLVALELLEDTRFNPTYLHDSEGLLNLSLSSSSVYYGNHSYKIKMNPKSTTN